MIPEKIEIKQIKKEITTKNEVVHEVVEELMLQTRFYRDIYKNLWRYNELSGIWIDDGAEYINATIRKQIRGEEAQKTYTVNEAISRINGLSYQEPPAPFPTADPRYIAFSNCVYDLKTKTRQTFRPDFYLTNKLAATLPLERPPCPKIEAFLDSIVSRKNKTVLLEWDAYTLYRGYPYQKFLALHGSGNNGKGVKMRLIQSLLGPQNLACRSLFSLLKDPHAAADLWNKHLNACGDLPYGTIEDSAPLKAATGGDLMVCNRKHKAPFPFTNYAKIVFSTNELPQTTDKSRAFYRRVEVVEFEQEFTGRENRDLDNELQTPQELSGYASWLIEILQELYDNKFNLSQTRTLEETAKLYEDLSNPILKAVFEKYEQAHDGIVYAGEVMRFLEGWSEENKRRKPAYKDVIKSLAAVGIEHDRHGSDRRAAYFGIREKFKTDRPEEEKEGKNTKNTVLDYFPARGRELIETGVLSVLSVPFANKSDEKHHNDIQKNELKLTDDRNAIEQKTPERTISDDLARETLKAIESATHKKGVLGVNGLCNEICAPLELTQDDLIERLTIMEEMGLIQKAASGSIITLTARGYTFKRSGSVRGGNYV
jgi:P4 family phage/plasmid primase-like protien